MTRKERARGIIEWFSVNMPIAETELHYRNPFELLVAVILSAQCTDKRINMVTPALFEAMPDAQTMAAHTQEDIFEYIKSVSYPNNKARNLLGMAKSLVEFHDGQVPEALEELIKLPGVGRKTANVILSVVFDHPAMAVDTHVFRVSEKLGLTTNSKSPLQTERELVKLIPQNLLGKAHHWLILHGRYVCKARRPECLNCGLTSFCRFYSRNTLDND